MKKMLMAILLIIVVGLAGGFLITGHKATQDAVNQSLDVGTKNIQRGQYSGAEVNFKQALDAEPDNLVASKTLRQVQAMQAGNLFYQQQHFYTAIKEYQRVIDNGQSEQLTNVAKQQLTQSQTLIDNLVGLTRAYNQALRLNHQRNFKASIAAVDQLSKNQEFGNQYFQSIAKRVAALKAANATKKIDRNTVTNHLAMRSASVLNFGGTTPSGTNS